MRGIVYTSNALSPFDDQQLLELANRAALRNLELGVTGYLNYEKSRFIQYIEGDFDPVTNLMARILRDPRHKVTHVLYDDQLTTRRFPHMADAFWLRKSEFIALEQVLADYISLMGVLSIESKAWDQTVWRMINTISESKGRFAVTK